ncbi:MAG TPA: hypothetical protein VFD83_02610 [Candidatus Polarisedimenticolia bacterium]|nr:hypothetical protein [Candidatus Polarisedimenticolia bacterium]
MFHRRTRLVAALLALALPLVVGACSKKSDDAAMSQGNTTTTPASDVHVTSVDLGKSVGTDNRVTDKTETFNPSDVIYATILTDGTSPNTVLKATWMFQDGQVVSQSERVIAPNGQAATEFHIEKPDGFPTGKYKVVVSLNGNPVQTKEFEVKAT